MKKKSTVLKICLFKLIVFIQVAIYRIVESKENKGKDSVLLIYDKV